MKYYLFLCALLHIALGFSQTCDEIFIDNFSTTQSWQQVGNGGVSVINNVCSFNQVRGGEYNKVIKPLGFTLNDSCWKASFDFKLRVSNNSGDGIAALLFIASAGDLDFMTYEGTTNNFVETNQDAIAVILYSDGQTNNNMDDWYFVLYPKNDDFRIFDLQNASVKFDKNIFQYYIDVEKTGMSSARMSVFYDNNRTQHLPGSPVNISLPIDIKNLTHVQISSSTPGAPTRYIDGEVDNYEICNNPCKLIDSDSAIIDNDTATVDSDTAIVNDKVYFYMPNAFSPNNDIINDFFFPIMNGIKQITWRVWDRWGEKVFECINDNSCKWDGTFKGKPLEPSVFLWEATFETNNNNIIKNKGSFVLVK